MQRQWPTPRTMACDGNRMCSCPVVIGLLLVHAPVAYAGGAVRPAAQWCGLAVLPLAIR